MVAAPAEVLAWTEDFRRDSSGYQFEDFRRESSAYELPCEATFGSCVSASDMNQGRCNSRSRRGNGTTMEVVSSMSKKEEQLTLSAMFGLCHSEFDKPIKKKPRPLNIAAD